MDKKHTPTPWQYSCPKGTDAAVYIDSGPTAPLFGDIAICYANKDLQTAKANAYFIVLACNSHESNIELIFELLQYIEHAPIDTLHEKYSLEEFRQLRDKARAVIINARIPF